MPADAKSREATRDALATLFTTNLVGVGKPCQAVYSHKKGDFEGESPVLLILSTGSDRVQFGVGSLKYRTVFKFQLQLWVADADPESSWTEANVEDTVDTIEKEIGDTIADNRTNASWDYLEHTGESTIIEATRKGKPYVVEIIPVAARVTDA